MTLPRTITVCLLSLGVCSCAKNQAVVTSKAMVQQPKQIELTWQPNYDRPNEATVIESTTDLTNRKWQQVFIGRTNRCLVANRTGHEFFRAGNVETNL